MRFAFALALTLAACSSDPAPAVDAGPADTGTAADLGAPVDTGIDVPRDTGTDLGLAPETPGLPDTGPAVDVGNDTGPPIDEPPPDTGPAVDVPAQLCAEYDRACTTDSECAVCSPVRGMAWCCGAVAGRRQCVVPMDNGMCMGAPDAGQTLNCARAEGVRCARHNDCAMCIAAPGQLYCCSSLDGQGECGLRLRGGTCD